MPTITFLLPTKWESKLANLADFFHSKTHLQRWSLALLSLITRKCPPSGNLSSQISQIFFIVNHHKTQQFYKGQNIAINFAREAPITSRFHPYWVSVLYLANKHFSSHQKHWKTMNPKLPEIALLRLSRYCNLNLYSNKEKRHTNEAREDIFSVFLIHSEKFEATWKLGTTVTMLSMFIL